MTKKGTNEKFLSDLNKKLVNKKLVKEADPFTQGYACACAILAQISGQSEGVNLLKEGGFNRKALEEGGVEKYDIDCLYGKRK